MPSLPTGTVTLLFTDIEGSTRLARRLGDGYQELLATHRRLLREAFTAHDGVEVDTQGDAFFVAFGRARDAVAAAAEAQRALVGLLGEGPDRDPHRRADAGRRRLLRGGRPLARRSHLRCRARRPGAALARDVRPGRRHRDARSGRARPQGHREPERIFQLVVPGLAQRFPPPRALVPGNLPRTRTAVRRSRAGARRPAASLLANETPVVTLTGPGGVGKTRLALEAARELRPSFPGGAYFVSFAARSADLTGVLAQTLEVEERAGEPLVEAVGRRLQASKALLVLDNFESALEAAHEVASLVEHCPQLKVLATSRVRLHLGAEHEYRLDPLTERRGVRSLRVACDRRFARPRRRGGAHERRGDLPPPRPAAARARARGCAGADPAALGDPRPARPAASVPDGRRARRARAPADARRDDRLELRAPERRGAGGLRRSRGLRRRRSSGCGRARRNRTWAARSTSSRRSATRACS